MMFAIVRLLQRGEANLCLSLGFWQFYQPQAIAVMAKVISKEKVPMSNFELHWESQFLGERFFNNPQST
jgi:hypothetical protein